MLRTFRRLSHHGPFFLILLLFISFRLLALLLFRPGGFITDFSDYDFYYTWGTLTPQGYAVYDNLWTAYPPLFPAIMLPIFELSSRIPPWVEPRLFFHLLFGLVLLLFEIGNLTLIYRLATRLAQAENWATQDLTASSARGHLVIPSSCHPVLLYALLFVPAYTMLGWFEPMPLFFLLLGLTLLLEHWRGQWAFSAVAAALGFLVKLTPALLVPVVVRWLGSKLSWRAAQDEWFNRNSPGNLLRPTLYALIFVAVVVGIGYPLVTANPALALSSFRVQSIRPPWQSIWALIDGFYGYGLVPLDMRNLVGLDGALWESRIPWTLVSLGFALVYLWLYTRRYDWTQPRTPVAFVGASVIWLFLYSKGWSPQFLLPVLAFLVLLLPTMRGALLAIVLSLVNFVEANVFLILLPDERWIMQGTVLVRTALLLLILVEFLGQIWPSQPVGRQMRRASAALSYAVMIIALVGTGVGAPRAAQAYGDRRLAEHSCTEAIAFLRENTDGVTDTIISSQVETWRDFYPWLRGEYAIHVLDDYSAVDRDPVLVAGDQLAALADDYNEFWWIEQASVSSRQSLREAAEQFFNQPDVELFDEERRGDCRMQRVVQFEETALATADVAGGPIQLLDANIGAASVGAEVELVLYWRADAPVAESYTVFTQLLDSAGALVAQQDNLPVNGLAPTNSWTPDGVVRDVYRLAVPPPASTGTYQLLVGLYTSEGRRSLTLADGAVSDHIAFSVNLDQ